MDLINGTIIGIGILSTSIAGISLWFQLKSLNDENKQERENEKNLNIKTSLECVNDISLVPEILKILYKSPGDDIYLNEKYTKAVKSGNELDNLLSNYYNIQIFQRYLFVINKLLQYLNSFYKFYPGNDSQKILEVINNAFQFNQLAMNRLVINFLEQAQNKNTKNLRKNKFYKIEFVSEMVHLYTVKIIELNDKSLIDSFIIKLKEFIDLISKEIELYISLYKKNDLKGIEKIIVEKNSCVALFFIDKSIGDLTLKKDECDLQAILSKHRSLYNYCLNLSDEETHFDYHCKCILNDKDKLLQISDDVMGTYPSPFFKNQLKFEIVT